MGFESGVRQGFQYMPLTVVMLPVWGQEWWCTAHPISFQHLSLPIAMHTSLFSLAYTHPHLHPCPSQLPFLQTSHNVFFWFLITPAAGHSAIFTIHSDLAHCQSFFFPFSISVAFLIVFIYTSVQRTPSMSPFNPNWQDFVATWWEQGMSNCNVHIKQLTDIILMSPNNWQEP
jgi:hypothetical protein